MPKHSFNFYFLKELLHPKPYSGYRQSVLLMIINKNETKNKNKFLFIREKTGQWFFPKGHLVGADIVSSLFESISENLEKELGLRGPRVYDIKPNFIQRAYIFDFERQRYNQQRGKEEQSRGNPHMGKIYHLAIMHYTGAEEFDTGGAVKVLEHKWVSDSEARNLLENVEEAIGSPSIFIEETHKFYKRFLEKILVIEKELERTAYISANLPQERLL